MSQQYIEIKEEKIIGGVVISRLFIRYTESVGNNLLDAFFKSEADGFYKFITETVFNEKEKAFLSYVEGGGRRSRFPITEYKLDITVTGRYKNAVSVKTLAFSAESGTVLSYKNSYRVFDTEKGTLCNARDFFKRKPKEKHDGFYIKNGRLYFYTLSDVPANSVKASEFTRLMNTVASFDIQTGKSEA